MTFGQEYLTHLRVIQDIGMARIDEIDYNGQKIVPLQFLKAVLPDPQNLGENYTGETSIGCRIYGLDKDGKPMTYYIYNNCSHHEAYLETGMQAVSYTTGVPAMVGAMMFLTGKWKKPVCTTWRSSTPIPSWRSWPCRDFPGTKSSTATSRSTKSRADLTLNHP